MIRTQNIIKIFYTNEVAVTALSNININIKKGEYVSIAGPSGCGKTTLLSIIGLVEQPTSGELRFLDIDVTKKSNTQRAKLRKGNIGYIFKDPFLLEELTVLENIELPLVYMRYKRKERAMIVEKALLKYKMIHLRNRYPSQLTNEQQQMTSILRAVITNPPLLLADEPTGNLHSKEGDNILSILSKLNEEGMTIVLATHSQYIPDQTHRIIRMFDGHIVTDDNLSL
jgi:putative ABC transport system ATP-binding protein